MLKITVRETSGGNVIKLEGRIAGPNVAEFERIWQSLAPSFDSSKKLSLDLCEVTFADGPGRQLLSEIYKKTGADFVADTPLAKFFAEGATRSNPSIQQTGD
jgi:hypothetical protein